MKIKWKKVVIVLFINIISICIFFLILNFCIYYCGLNSKDSFYNKLNSYISFLKRDISEKDTYYTLISSQKFRPIENRSLNKGGIVLFGCSFVYGSELNNKQTISYKLAKLAQRPVYNRAIEGWGVQHMLYQLNNDDFYNIVPKPEYIIYVYYDGHLSRMYTPITPSYPDCYCIFYKKTKKGFVPKKRTFFSDKIIIQHYIKNNLIRKLEHFNKFYSFEENLLADYIIESRNEAEKHWGKDIKFVVLFYSLIKNEQIYERLQSNNILTIDVEDFKIDVDDKQYQISSTNVHPNEKAWDVIVPIIVKKLKL